MMSKGTATKIVFTVAAGRLDSRLPRLVRQLSERLERISGVTVLNVEIQNGLPEPTVQVSTDYTTCNQGRTGGPTRRGRHYGG